MEKATSNPAFFWLVKLICLRPAACAMLAFTIVTVANAQSRQPQREIFTPASDRGPVVVVASGASGLALYRDIAARLATLGYYVVLMSGHDSFTMLSNDQSLAVSALRSVIAEAQAAPKALGERAVLIGYSLGGVGVLPN